MQLFILHYHLNYLVLTITLLKLQANLKMFILLIQKVYQQASVYKFYMHVN